MAGSYEVLDHTADTAIAVSADSLEELVAWSVRGMVALMFDTNMQALETVALRVEAQSWEDLVVDLLAEVLWLMESADVVPVSTNEVSLGEYEVVLELGVAPRGHEELVGPPIKAVTYHELRCESIAGGWMVRVIFDV